MEQLHAQPFPVPRTMSPLAARPVAPWARGTITASTPGRGYGNGGKLFYGSIGECSGMAQRREQFRRSASAHAQETIFPRRISSKAPLRHFHDSYANPRERIAFSFAFSRTNRLPF